jgi:hypothetical protein
MLAVLTARFVVRNVLEKRKNLEVITLVESDVKMPECRGCKSIQIRDARIPRQLIRLPVEITQDKIFNNRGIPVFLCEYCDEYELAGALEAHQKRIDNK